MLLAVSHSNSDDLHFKEGTYTINKDNSCAVETGTLEISNLEKESFDFSIAVKNTKTLFLGGIEGIAHFDEDSETATYEIMADEDTDSIITTLEFKLSSNKQEIIVIGRRTYIYHGAGICFDGNYSKD